VSHNWRDVTSIILPPGLVFILALITGILSKTLLLETPSKENYTENTIEMSGVEIVHNKFDNKKHSLNLIAADKVVYKGKRMNFFNPNLISYVKDQDFVEISSLRANSNSDMSVVNLSGAAEIRQVDDEGKTVLKVSSEELVFKVKDKIIETDRAVVVEQNQFRIDGTGMIFDQKLSTFEVKQQASLKSRSLLDK
tara:strand:+ start:354 stop:938 length:585 start_codon:yes stop_codon:yes gene_type:complete